MRGEMTRHVRMIQCRGDLNEVQPNEPYPRQTAH